MWYFTSFNCDMHAIPLFYKNNKRANFMKQSHLPSTSAGLLTAETSGLILFEPKSVKPITTYERVNKLAVGFGIVWVGD